MPSTRITSKLFHLAAITSEAIAAALFALWICGCGYAVTISELPTGREVTSRFDYYGNLRLYIAYGAHPRATNMQAPSTILGLGWHLWHPVPSKIPGFKLPDLFTLYIPYWPLIPALILFAWACHKRCHDHLTPV